MDSDEDFVDDSPSPFPEGSEDYGIEFDKPDVINKPQNQTGRYYLDEEDFYHEVLEPGQIVEFMRSIIQEVAEIVRLPLTYCRVLLHHFRWDKGKMMEQYVTGDQEKLFKLAGLPVSAIMMLNSNNMLQSSSSQSRPSSLTNAPATRSSKQTASTSPLCGICYGVVTQSSMLGGECGHQFCTTCWNGYLTFKIMSEGVGQTLACPAFGCNVILDDMLVLKLVKESNVKQRYQHLITNSFVETNRLLAWCPGKDCGRAIRVREFAAKPVTCTCGTVFCFACHHQRHEPIRCELLKRWLKKCDDDSETSNWIAANTKECPRCHVTIEKDGGCNHMVCKNQACRHDFCWVCLGPWEPHGSSWYNCNRFNDDDAKRAREGQEKSRTALQRYLHYCNRYGAHLNSMKHENKLYTMAQVKMDQLQQMNMSWIEVQFLKQAVDTLCRCRQTLMYTYAFAYYLRSNNQSAIFEGNQGDLERATEELSEYLERQIKLDELNTIKQKVQDKSRYCENRRRCLLEHVYEGYENDWWEFSSA